MLRDCIVTRLVLLAVVAAGCVESHSRYCASGRVCTTDRLCDEAHDTCVLPDQLRSCEGLPETAPCTIGGELVGICRDSVCVDVACGDGVVSGLEECDGAAIEVSDCTQLGYYDPGPVTCDATCHYDVTACARRCGDLVLDPEEQCEGAAGIDRDDCTDHGYYEPGPVTCSSCLYDVSACAGTCGDGMRNGEELCDGDEPPALACTDLGFDRGRVGCGSCAADLAACSHIGWPSLVSAGTTEWYSAWSAGPGHVIAVGSAGAFVEVVGEQISEGALANGSHALHDVWGVSSGDMFVVDALGGVWRGSPSGWTVSRAQVGATGSLHAIAGTAASDVWAVGAQERILHHDGSGWSEVRTGTGVLRDVWVGTSGQGIAVGDGGLVVRRAGIGWVAETSGTTKNLTGVWSDGSTAFAVGAGGTILRHDSGSWSPMASGTTADLLGIYGRSASDLYSVGASGVLLHFDGKTWWPLDGTVSATLPAVTGSAVEVFIVDSLGAVRRSDASWSPPAHPGGSGLYASLAIGGEQEILAATTGSSCGLFQRGEANWTAIAQTCTAFFGWGAIWIGPGGEIFAAERDGSVHRFDGQSWAVDAPGTAGGDIVGLWGAGATEVWAASRDGTLSRWNGASWSEVPTGSTHFAAIHGTSATDVYAVGWEIWHWNGSTWTDNEPPGVYSHWNDVWAAGPDDVWVVGSDGAILRRDASGWTTVSSGTVAALNAVAGSAPDDVWIAGASGIILHDDGAGFTSVKSPETADYHDIVVRDDLVVLAGWDDGLFALIREPGAW